ncbi:hypothetical protein [Agrobacterium sp. CG674]
MKFSSLTAENKLYVIFSYLIALVLMAAVIAWASVLIPVTFAVFAGVYLLCFLIGWTARGAVLVIRKVKALFGY